MKLVVSRLDLVALISKIQSLVPSKPSLPILSNILVEAANDLLTISATDLTVSVRCELEAKVIEEGSLALPARRFFQLIRELTSAQIKISAETQEIAEITSGTSVFKINGMSKLEFPTISDLAGAPEIAFQAGELKDLLLKSAFCAARDDSRYMLNGVALHLQAGKASFTGTDGKRLAKVSAPLSVDGSLKGQYVLPIKAVEEMARILDSGEAKAALAIGSDKLSLSSGSTTLVAKLLSGQYPEVERVIPTHLTHNVLLHREELGQLLRQVSLFTSEESSSVRFQFETGQLHLSATSSSIGEGRVSMPVDFTGDRFDIAFNPFYFVEMLRHSKDETIRLGLNDPHNPGLVTDSTGSLFVLMPMRLHEIARNPEAEPV